MTETQIIDAVADWLKTLSPGCTDVHPTIPTVFVVDGVLYGLSRTIAHQVYTTGVSGPQPTSPSPTISAWAQSIAAHPFIPASVTAAQLESAKECFKGYTGGVFKKCECGAHAVGSSSHSTWCAVS